MTSVAATTTGTTASGSAGTSGTINNQADYNTAYTNFLQMLTTELKNQDPTSPIDTAQFTQQLVGFSQLEQQLHSNSDLDKLVTGQTSTGVGSALGYLGHTVTVPGNSLTADGTTPVTLGYTLPSQATSATLTISDKTGAVVSTVDVPGDAGTHSVVFDDASGDQATLPAGTYQVSIQAEDTAGKSLKPTTTIKAKVSGVDSSSGSVELIVAGQQYASSAVTAITN